MSFDTGIAWLRSMYRHRNDRTYGITELETGWFL